MAAMKRVSGFLILWSVTFGLLVCLVVPAMAHGLEATSWQGQAGEALELASLEIALWPEFDRPDMLIIYQGVLVADTPLPVPVEIRIPARAGQPTAVAFTTEAGERLNQTYTTRVEGDNLVVSFDLSSLGFQLEYYDALPVGASGERDYTLGYTADYAVSDLSLEFQIPPTARSLAVDPPAGSAETGSDGLVYHRLAVGPVMRGETRNWTFQYIKDDDELTASSNAANPLTGIGGSTPAPAPASQDGDSSAVLIFVVAFVALVAVGTAAFWLGRSTSPRVNAWGREGNEFASRAPSRRQAPGYGTRGQAATGRGPGNRTPQDRLFCYKCGAELRSDGEYCHKCGTPVRK